MQQVTDILNQIAPFVIYAVYAGGALLALGVVALMLRLFCGTCVGLLKLSSRLLMLLGFALMIYQIILVVAGIAPTSNLVFNEYPVWAVALGMLVPGFLLRLIASLKPTR
jgi:hypothetical protein